MKPDKTQRPKRLSDRVNAVATPPQPQTPSQTRWQRRAQWLRNHPVVVTMETAGLVGLVFAVVLFFYELRERQDERIARAWQLVTTSATGNSGKREALDYLNRQYGCWLRLVGFDWCWKKRIVLRGINLSVEWQKGEGTYLWSVDLEDALLNRTNFHRAQLVEANLTGVTAYNASWTEGLFNRALFISANLRGVRFSKSTFYGTVFTGSCLRKPDFSESDFWNEKEKQNAKRAIFHNAGLYKAKFRNTDLRNADFTGATLNNVEFTGAKLEGLTLNNTKITGAWAYDWNFPKHVPNGLTITKVSDLGSEPSGIPEPPQCEG